MKSYKGFGVLEALLLVIIAGILVGTGWYVWNSKNKTNLTLDNTNSTSNSNIQRITLDPTTDWTLFSSTEGNYTLRHPPGWTRAANLERCNPGLFMAGSDTKSTGVCGSESFGQITVYSVTGNHERDYQLGDGYTRVTSTTIRADGVSGTMMFGVASGQQQESEIGTVGLADGTEVTTYIFYANGRTYVATFKETIPPSGALADFNTMVTRTLRFSVD